MPSQKGAFLLPLPSWSRQTAERQDWNAFGRNESFNMAFSLLAYRNGVIGLVLLFRH